MYTMYRQIFYRDNVSGRISFYIGNIFVRNTFATVRIINLTHDEILANI